MPVTFRIDDGILIMTLTGNWSLQDSFAARAESAQLQRTHGIQSILVDMRNAHSELSTIELFDFFASFQDVYIPGTKHAVLDSEKTHTLADAQFAETVARNRGIIMKMFHEYDEALAWLRPEARQSPE